MSDVYKQCFCLALGLGRLFQSVWIILRSVNIFPHLIDSLHLKTFAYLQRQNMIISKVGWKISACTKIPLFLWLSRILTRVTQILKKIFFKKTPFASCEIRHLQSVPCVLHGLQLEQERREKQELKRQLKVLQRAKDSVVGDLRHSNHQLQVELAQAQVSTSTPPPAHHPIPHLHPHPLSAVTLHVSLHRLFL